MELQHPLRVLTPTADADVLRVLARADESFTGREVARLVTDYSRSGVRKVLGRLVLQGIVLQDRVGPSHQYRLNREHLAAPHIIALTRLRDQFDEKVADLVDGWSLSAEAVVLFGSAARGAMTVDSDIDLFVVGPTGDPTGRWHAQTTELAEQVTAWTGNDARVLEMDPEEVRLAVEDEQPLLEDVLREGQVLYGDPSYLRKLSIEHRKAVT